jgi:hypothetical protein
LFGFIGGHWWLRIALTSLFFGKAVLPLIQLIGAIHGKPVDLMLAGGYRGMAAGSVIAGLFIGIGAVLQRSFFGFLVAYGAFSYAWVWSWVGWQVSQPKKDLGPVAVAGERGATNNPSSKSAVLETVCSRRADGARPADV